MSAELVAFIVGEDLDPSLNGCKRLDDYDRISALALDHRGDGLRVVSANDGGVSFPMTDLLAAFNVHSTLAQGPAVGDLPSAVSPTGGTLSLLLLAAEVFPQVAALGLICIHVLIKRLGAH